MKVQIVVWSITSALAGFLFGFDTVVISGAEQTIQALWGLTPVARHRDCRRALRHGYGVARRRMANRSVRPSADAPRDRRAVSRRALWSAVATNVDSFTVARSIGGLGIGISTVAAPLYISEIAPPAHRGRLAGMFQFNIVFGIVVAFLSNALLARIGEKAWRWMLGVAAFPALLYTHVPPPSGEPALAPHAKAATARRARVLRLIEPELADRSDRAARRRLSRGSPSRNRVGVLDVELAHADHARVPGRLLQPALGHQRDPLFRPAHLRAHRVGAKAALLQSVGIGLTNLVFTFVGLWLIDRLGRRTLLLDWIVRLHRVARAHGLGVLYRTFRHRPGVHLRLHRRARHRPGRGDLGVHLRDLPRPFAPGAGARQLYALDVRRTAHDLLPAHGDRIGAGHTSSPSSPA